MTSAPTLPTPPAAIEVIPIDALVRPLGTTPGIVAVWQEFLALKARLLTDDDYQQIGGRNYTKKSGWRKLATAFGLSLEILDTHRHDRGDDSWYYVCLVNVSAPNGRHAQAEGVCDSLERKFSHPEHDTRATAQTRAYNRAIADLIGGGETSAEELHDSPGPVTPPRSALPPPAPDRARRPANDAWTVFWGAMSNRGLTSDAVTDLLGTPAPNYAKSEGLRPEDLTNLVLNLHETAQQPAAVE